MLPYCVPNPEKEITLPQAAYGFFGIQPVFITDTRKSKGE